MKIKSIIVAAFTAVCVAGPVYPESAYNYPETEVFAGTASTNLLSVRSWVVTHYYDIETGEQSCDADVVMGRLDDFSMFSISVQRNSGVNLVIAGPRSLWSGESQDDLFLAIDGEKWTLNNASFDSTDGQFGSSRVEFGFSRGTASALPPENWIV